MELKNIAPLKGSFMIISILGALVSLMYLFPKNATWGFLFTGIFVIMFIAAMISMTYGPDESMHHAGHELEKKKRNRPWVAFMRNLRAIFERNKKVETDKAWEISKTRRGIIAVLSYFIVVFLLFLIGVPHPWVAALVPAIGFLLSTLTLSICKRWWLKNIYKKWKKKETKLLDFKFYPLQDFFNPFKPLKDFFMMRLFFRWRHLFFLLSLYHGVRLESGYLGLDSSNEIGVRTNFI